MTMEPPVFYAPPENITEDGIELGTAESHHAQDVMRMTAGRLVIVVDGLGNAYRGEIAGKGRSKVVRVKVHSQIRNFGEPAAIVTLACGLSTGYKFDTVIEKGTELGVKRFVPLLTEKSKVKVDDPKRAASKVTRFEKVALAAMKQCRRSYRPEISFPVSFSEYVDQTDLSAANLIFHPSKDATSFDNLRLKSTVRRVNILVGPESGFSDSELELAAGRGYIPVHLGKRILRTETAGPVICALLLARLGEFR
jgi:16S rRNA (uracil1498-N3)-methyltransferase